MGFPVVTVPPLLALGAAVEVASEVRAVMLPVQHQALAVLVATTTQMSLVELVGQVLPGRVGLQRRAAVAVAVAGANSARSLLVLAPPVLRVLSTQSQRVELLARGVAAGGLGATLRATPARAQA